LSDKKTPKNHDITTDRLFAWQKLKLKRIKKKYSMPDIVKIHCISHVWLNGQKHKIYIGRHEPWAFSTELYLVNIHNGKWYELINEIIRKP
jgi:hypothetical protein